jgi:DNA repair protein RadC
MFHQNEKIMEALRESMCLNEVSEITIAYRPKVKASHRPKVTCSRQVYEVLLRFWNKDALEYVEHFQVMLLNRGNRVPGELPGQ